MDFEKTPTRGAGELHQSLLQIKKQGAAQTEECGKDRSEASDPSRTSLHQQPGKVGSAGKEETSVPGCTEAVRRHPYQPRSRQRGNLVRTGTKGKSAAHMALPKTTQRNGNVTGGGLIPVALSRVFGEEDMDTDSPTQSLKRLLADKATRLSKGGSASKASPGPYSNPPAQQVTPNGNHSPEAHF